MGSREIVNRPELRFLQKPKPRRGHGTLGQLLHTVWARQEAGFHFIHSGLPQQAIHLFIT